MADRNFLAWPFFEERHRVLGAQLEEWCQATIHDAEAADPDYACRALVQELGRSGFRLLAKAWNARWKSLVFMQTACASASMVIASSIET